MTTDLRLAAGTRLPEDGWSDRDRAQAQLVQRRCYLGVSLVGALAHGLVQADQRGEVLAVGEPAGPGRAAEAVRHRSMVPVALVLPTVKPLLLLVSLLGPNGTGWLTVVPVMCHAPHAVPASGRERHNRALAACRPPHEAARGWHR